MRAHFHLQQHPSHKKKVDRHRRLHMQTRLLFDKYLKSMKVQTWLWKGTACAWIYEIYGTNNYADVVKARNDVFDKYGLTAGDPLHYQHRYIGGRSAGQNLQQPSTFHYPGIKKKTKKYLQALVPSALPRMRVWLSDRAHDWASKARTVFISAQPVSTKDGWYYIPMMVINKTRSTAQREYRFCSMTAGRRWRHTIFIIYLPTISDYAGVLSFMKTQRIQTSRASSSMPTYRPEWLIEMECVAQLPQSK